MGNSADLAGAAAYYALVNCTIVSNTAATDTGGVVGELIRNCVIFYNTSPNLGNYDEYFQENALENCCTYPIPTTGTGNFTNAPLFIEAELGNFRFRTNSPCIDAGDSSSVFAQHDRDGRPRIVGSTADVGAYEFQGPGTGEFISWLEEADLPTDGSADYSDSDGDGANNWQEWRADTGPTNALSVLRMITATSAPLGADVSWSSVATRSYWLERATNLGAASAFEAIATNIVGSAGTKTYTDRSATNDGPYFYRVGVQ